MSHISSEKRWFPFAQISFSSIPGTGNQNPDVIDGDRSDGQTWLPFIARGCQVKTGETWVDATIKFSYDGVTNYYAYAQVGTATVDRYLGGPAYGNVNYLTAPALYTGSDDLCLGYDVDPVYHIVTESASGWSLRSDSRMHVMRFTT